MSGDRIGVLVDWIDNYRCGDLAGLVATFEADAIVECECTGMMLSGADEIGAYWRERIDRHRAGDILDLRQAGDAILLTFIAGTTIVAARFRFGSHGLIASCSCRPATGLCVPGDVRSA